MDLNLILRTPVRPVLTVLFLMAIWSLPVKAQVPGKNPVNSNRPNNMAQNTTGPQHQHSYANLSAEINRKYHLPPPRQQSPSFVNQPGRGEGVYSYRSLKQKLTTKYPTLNRPSLYKGSSVSGAEKRNYAWYQEDYRKKMERARELRESGD